MPDDRERILNRLQSSLRHEYMAAASYEAHAARALELRCKEIAQKLRDVAASHREHIARLEQRIHELGGCPIAVDPPKSLSSRNHCLEAGDMVCALEQDLRAEDTEIEEYETLARQSDERTAELCEGCIREDREHLRWLRDQLAQEQGMYVDE
jgi:bacterioferritin (cytochrome b1)